jgi:hypothetical protein
LSWKCDEPADAVVPGGSEQHGVCKDSSLGLFRKQGTIVVKFEVMGLEAFGALFIDLLSLFLFLCIYCF